MSDKQTPADFGTNETDFTRDVLGSKVCDSWETVQAWLKANPSGFDVVIVGAGTFGGYLADKLYRADIVYTELGEDGKASKPSDRTGTEQGPRILVIEEGPFLLPTHFQNLPGNLSALMIAFPDRVGNAQIDVLRPDVWKLPWEIGPVPAGVDARWAADVFYGLAYCVGGRSVFWSGWSPRLKESDLALWPQDVSKHLLYGPKGYEWVEREIGADSNTDYMKETALYRALDVALNVAVHSSPGGSSSGLPNVKEVRFAPLAVLASPPQPGLFPFDKFSSVTFLIDAVCEDRRVKTATERRLFVLPRTKVNTLTLDKARRNVTRLDLSLEGTKQGTSLEIGGNTVVVLANGTIEATRLALNDLDVGKPVKSAPEVKRVGNFMSHLRSNIFVRIKRKALEKYGLPKQLDEKIQEVAAFIVRGEDKNRRFHYQVVAAAVPDSGGPESVIWTMVPDVELVDPLRRNPSKENIQIVFRVVGEIKGDPDPDTAASWIQSGRSDGHGSKRACVNLVLTQEDWNFWESIDATAIKLARAIAGSEDDLVVKWYHINKDGLPEYQWPGEGWQKRTSAEILEDLALRARTPGMDVTGWRDPLGSTHHEGGTLYMGDKPGESITDTYGRFHNIENAYVVGPAVYPTIGSANPVLTGLTLARRTGEAIIDKVRKSKKGAATVA